MQSKKTNSLLSLYRVIFAIGILLYHDYVPVRVPFFHKANFFVDFFFVLSGFFFLKSIAKFDKMDTFPSMKTYLVSRLKKMGIPLLISYLCNVLYSILNPNGLHILHYLWFIHILLIMELLFLFIYKVSENSKKVVFIAAVVVFVVGFSLYLLPDFANMDEFRGICYIPLGILCSFLPPIKAVQRSKVLGVLCILCCWTLFGGTVLLVYQFPATIKLLALFIFPALIYFTMHLEVEISLFKHLPRMSLWLYIYQSVPYLLRAIEFGNNTAHFFIILGLVFFTEEMYLVAEFMPKEMKEKIKGKLKECFNFKKWFQKKIKAKA
ncbi:MAG: acyltransferase family protein [Clostridia bacterium]|nr:acyltransferase family protein [Clostridia bacterium]